jgi:acetyl-CoA carboxylase biotin carboxyl carrier protein
VIESRVASGSYDTGIVDRLVASRRPRSSSKEAEMAEIRAEMVANVWKLVAAEGTRIEVGDELCVLESMKMEIPVVAEASGVLRRFAVAEGDAVQEGDLIAIVDF